jgi:restriction system-associated AAA family ATPase
LLDELDVRLRDVDTEYDLFDPLCLVGPNGSGKSQFMQVIAEIFQTLCHRCVPSEERLESNSSLLFEVEYLIRPAGVDLPVHVRASRQATGRKRRLVVIERKVGDTWEPCDPENEETAALLPAKVIGYTSGDNETLSLPFLVTRAGYADEVRNNALNVETRATPIPDTRLMMIDYATNLEILVANQLLSEPDTRNALVADSNVRDIHSCRCIVQLNHPAAPKGPKKVQEQTGRKGVQLTKELDEYLDNLKRCSTCYTIDDETETYTFDLLIDDETRKAFRWFWSSALELYSAFHKLAMLNDLVIPKRTRERFRRETRERRFASRLPEPQDEDKVFRFEQVKFMSAFDGSSVDYVALSDGEHQLTQILGTVAMQASPGVLFLMDEPESHFNPVWRIRFISRLLSLPTINGRRGDAKHDTRVDEQECILTTHAPFVPSDMRRDRIFVFAKDKESNKVVIRHPEVETYGTTFDTIVETCFGIQPPIAKRSLDEIEKLLESTDALEIEEAIGKLGHSVEKAFLVDHLNELKARRA